MHRKETLYGTHFAQATLMTVGRENQETMLLGIVLYAVEHRSKVVGNEIGNNHSYDMRPLLTKTLRKGVRMIIALLGQFLHLFTHFLTHLMATMKSSRDGCYADMKLSG